MSSIPSASVLTTFENGRWLIQNSPTLAASIIAVNWIGDGITASESEAVQEVVTLAAFHEALTASLIDRPWFGDGITRTELEGIKYLGYIAYDDTAAARRIAAMPFLAAIEPADVSALEALAGLAGDVEDLLQQILSHPSLTDGISDAVTPIVAMLDGVAEARPDLIGKLLRPAAVDLERRGIVLPLTGEVELAIVRTGPGAGRSMDLLEHSVRATEELMGRPFPTRFVGLLYEDAVTSGGYTGTNWGTHIAVTPKYDVDDGSHEARSAPHLIAHEVSHYFWSGNADWIDEGVSDFMASSAENMRMGTPIGITNDPCAFARSIIELKTLAPDPDADYDVFRCNYSLGERLFVDMYRTLGEHMVWRGLRDLYDKSLVENGTDDLKGTALDIRHVREAFRSTPGSSISIKRWYDGTETYDVAHLGILPADPTLPSINGQIDDAYINIGKDGLGVSSFSVTDAGDRRVWLNLDYSYNVTSGPHELILDFVEFYEDGFEFRWGSIEITAQSEYIGGSLSVSLGPNIWAPGSYWVYLYAGDRKVAELQYEVTL